MTCHDEDHQMGMLCFDVGHSAGARSASVRWNMPDHLDKPLPIIDAWCTDMKSWSGLIIGSCAEIYCQVSWVYIHSRPTCDGRCTAILPVHHWQLHARPCFMYSWMHGRVGWLNRTGLVSVWSPIANAVWTNIVAAWRDSWSVSKHTPTHLVSSMTVAWSIWLILDTVTAMSAWWLMYLMSDLWWCFKWTVIV